MPIVLQQASYPGACSGTVTSLGVPMDVTPQNCNKPLTTTDARNFVTGYLWNRDGSVNTIRAPQVDGVTPETHYYYSSAGAWYYGANGGSALDWSRDQVNLLTAVRTCRNGNWGCAVEDESRTDINYYGGPSPTNMNLSDVTKGSGNVAMTKTRYDYDDYGNVTGISAPFVPGGAPGASTQRVYVNAPAHQLSDIIEPDPDGSGGRQSRVTHIWYRSDGLPSIVGVGTSPSGSFAGQQYVTPLYDDYGRKVLETTSDGTRDYTQTRYSFDAAGRLDCTSVRMTVSTFLDLKTAPACVQSSGGGGNDRITQNIYEFGGGLGWTNVRVGTALAHKAAGYVHNSNGQLKQVTQYSTPSDTTGATTTYEYDNYRQFVKRVYYPDPASGASSSIDYEEMVRDGNGNVTDRYLRDPGHTHLSYTYDALNRLTSKVRPGEATVTFKYDNLGNMIQSTQGNVQINNTYDALGQLRRSAQRWGALDYTYDAAGRRTSVSWEGARLTVGYCYDAAGYLLNVREGAEGCSGGTVLASFTYNDLGNRTSISRANGVTTSLNYDAMARVNQIAQTFPNATDSVAIKIGDPSTPHDSTGYNAANQIASRTVTNNLYAWTQAYNVGRGYAADRLNRYTYISSGNWENTFSPSYADGRGNLTSTGVSTYQYSTENLMSGSASDSITLGYDGLNRLIDYNTSFATHFVYDGGEIATEVDNSGTILRRYVTADGSDQPIIWYEGAGTADKRWLLSDERGSIISVTDGTGQQLAINTYDDYGIPASTNLGRFQYTGQAWLPELGLYYYKARMYSATLGRFMQTDPVGYGDGLNLYNYVHGDPVNGTDPSGTTVFFCPNCYTVYATTGGSRTTSISVPSVGTGATTTSAFSRAGPLGGYGAILAAAVSQTRFLQRPLQAQAPAPQQSASTACSAGPRVSYGGGPSFTGFMAVLGLSGGVSANITLPRTSTGRVSLRGAQLSVTGSLTPLVGLGMFAAAGPSGSASSSNEVAPLWQGSVTPVLQGGAADGFGAEATRALNGDPLDWSGSGGRIGGGGYAAVGIRFAGTLASPPLGCSR